jgi:recombinational DNA repair protein (RecF pathway)
VFAGVFRYPFPLQEFNSSNSNEKLISTAVNKIQEYLEHYLDNTPLKKKIFYETSFCHGASIFF